MVGLTLKYLALTRLSLSFSSTHVPHILRSYIKERCLIAELSLCHSLVRYRSNCYLCPLFSCFLRRAP